jgi:hypothetical protein
MRFANEENEGQHVKAVTFKLDDFVISPTSALRFISLSLRRTISTPRDTKFARLEFGTYYKAVCESTSDEDERITGASFCRHNFDGFASDALN